MLKKVLIGLLLLMPASSQAIVPFTVEDVNIYENFLALDAAIKAQAKATASAPTNAPVDYLLFREGSSYYKVTITTGGYINVVSTPTANSIDYIWLPANASGVYKMSITSFVPNLQYIPISFSASNLLLFAEGSTNIWLLSGLSNYFNVQYLGAI